MTFDSPMRENDRFLEGLNRGLSSANLVSMTRIQSNSPLSATTWSLQDAKARFSELVRRVHNEGPQHVTVHGRDEVVVLSAQDYRRLRGTATGQQLIDLLAASPHREVEIAPQRAPMPVRDVSL